MDSSAPSTQESTASVLAALTSYLPGFMNVMNQQVLPQSQADLAAAQATSPAYDQLQADLYKQIAPQLAETGANVDKISREAATNTDLDIMKGSGGELVTQAQTLDKQLNPEYYNTRALEGSKLGEILNSVNLNNATPEAERLVNQENVRSGNINTPSATGTVSNALSFGNERLKRMSALSDAIGQATNFLQPSQSQFNPVVTALNRPSANTGVSQFNGVQQPSDQAYATGNNLVNNITSTRAQENQINANKRDALDRVDQTLSAI